LTPEEVKQEYNHGQTLQLGSLSASPTGGAGAGTSTDSASIEYCVPGGTDQCDPPVARWKMDKQTGDTAYDTSGANDGTLGSGAGVDAADPTHRGGPYCHAGGCLEFDGSDDYVTISSALSTTTNFTVSAWVKTNNASGWDDIMAGDCGDMIFSLSSGVLKFGGQCNEPWAVITGSNVADGNWHHVVGWFNGTTAKIYLDGAEDASDTKSGAFNKTGQTIGDADSGSENFNGSIDDVRVYDYARTPAQIAWEYNRGGPVGHWSMDSVGYAANSSSTIYDASGNGYNGTYVGEVMNNGTTTASTLPTWRQARDCKYSNCLEFDDVNDYVDLGDNFEGYSAITASAWVYKTSNGTFDRIISKYWDGTDRSWYLASNASDLACFLIATNTNNTNDIACGGTMSLNTWHHLVGTWDADTDVIKMYLDGALTTTSVQIGDTVRANDSPTYIGLDHYDGAMDYGFPGLIDEVRIYDTALSATQVEALYLNNDRSAGASKEDNLVGEWRFDEGGGSEMVDTHYQRDGLRNYAMEFDGSGSYMDMGDVLDIDTNDMSMSYWLKTSTSSTGELVSKGSSGNSRYYSEMIGSTGIIMGNIGDVSGNTDIIGVTAVNDSQWHHVVVVFDRDANGEIYIDGVLDATADISSRSASIANADTLRIGYYSGGSSSFFDGLIDEVKIYNYALTEAQIRNDYNQGAARFGPSSGLP